MYAFFFFVMPDNLRFASHVFSCKLGVFATAIAMLYEFPSIDLSTYVSLGILVEAATQQSLLCHPGGSDLCSQ
jgi:hypothetical protein